MAEPRRPTTSSAVLQIGGLNVYYGHSHALQGVDLTLQHGVLSVVGRGFVWPECGAELGHCLKVGWESYADLHGIVEVSGGRQRRFRRPP